MFGNKYKADRPFLSGEGGPPALVLAPKHGHTTQNKGTGHKYNTACILPLEFSSENKKSQQIGHKIVKSYEAVL